MGFTRYFVFPLDGKWLVGLDGRVMARHESREEAQAGATVMANLMGAMQYDADVIVDRGDGNPLEIVWVYGRDSIDEQPRRKRRRAQKNGHMQQVQRAAEPTAQAI